MPRGTPEVMRLIECYALRGVDVVTFDARIDHDPHAPMGIEILGWWRPATDLYPIREPPQPADVLREQLGQLLSAARLLDRTGRIVAALPDLWIDSPGLPLQLFVEVGRMLGVGVPEDAVAWGTVSAGRLLPARGVLAVAQHAAREGRAQIITGPLARAELEVLASTRGARVHELADPRLVHALDECRVAPMPDPFEREQPAPPAPSYAHPLGCTAIELALATRSPTMLWGPAWLTSGWVDYVRAVLPVATPREARALALERNASGLALGDVTRARPTALLEKTHDKERVRGSMEAGGIAVAAHEGALLLDGAHDLQVEAMREASTAAEQGTVVPVDGRGAVLPARGAMICASIQCWCSPRLGELCGCAAYQVGALRAMIRAGLPCVRVWAVLDAGARSLGRDHRPAAARERIRRAWEAGSTELGRGRVVADVLEEALALLDGGARAEHREIAEDLVPLPWERDDHPLFGPFTLRP